MTVRQPWSPSKVASPPSGHIQVEKIELEKLDAAMNVLTNLLIELELDMQDHPASVAPKRDMSSKTCKMDATLMALTQNLAELEQDLRRTPNEDPKVPGDLASTRRAIQENDLAAGEKKEVFAKVLSSAPLQPIIYQRAPSPSGWNGAVRFVPSPRHSSPPLSQPSQAAAGPPRVQQPQRPMTQPVQGVPHPQAMQVDKDGNLPKQLSSAQAMANAAMNATANLTPGISTAPVLGLGRSASPGGRPAPPPPMVPPSSCWRSPSEGHVHGVGLRERPAAQSPMRREGWQSPAPRGMPSPRQSGLNRTPGFGRTTASPLSAAGRSPSEGRVPSGPGGLPGWTAGGGSCARRDGSRPAPHSFNLCRSSTSMSSHNASFYAPQSAMGGGGFSTTPVPAASYIVDIADPVDQMLGSALRTLDAAAASKLMLRRLAPGRYEIDGRKVSVRWSEQGGLMVIEDEVRGSPMPLPAYLGQAGNVVASLTGHRADMPKITRVPKSQRLTFDDAKAEKNLAAQIEKLGSERCESMRLAVEQARLREEAAEAYEKLTQGFAPSRMLRPSPVRTSL